MTFLNHNLLFAIPMQDNLLEDYEEYSEEKHLAGKHNQKTHAGRDTQQDISIKTGSSVVRQDTEADWNKLNLKRPTDQELLDVFDISDRFPGTHVEIVTNDKLYKDVYDTVHSGTPDDNRIFVNIEIANENGQSMASISRVFALDKNGQPFVYHDKFDLNLGELNMSQTGKGIGTDVLEKSEALYEKMGVKKIVLTANSEVGRYAWARMGFDFKDGLIRSQMTKELESYLDDRNVRSDFINSILPLNYHTWDMAAWKHPSKPEINGKDFLLNYASSYEAEKVLDDRDPGYKVGKMYYAARHKVRP